MPLRASSPARGRPENHGDVTSPWSEPRRESHRGGWVRPRVGGWRKRGAYGMESSRIDGSLLLGSVISAITNRAILASNITVSLISRFDG